MLFGRNADAGGANKEMEAGVGAIHGIHIDAEFDFSNGSELDRISQQIVDDLLEPRGIGDDLARHAGANVAQQF